MKRHTKLCALCLLGLSVLQAQAQDSDMLTQSRAVTQAMLKELGQKLQSSMAEGGPINAIGVCHFASPRHRQPCINKQPSQDQPCGHTGSQSSHGRAQRLASQGLGAV